MSVKIVEGGVCAAEGFLAAGLYAGIKKNLLGKDLGLIFSEIPATAAGVFTTNKIKAACVTVSKEHLANKKAQAVIVNSGNANCCTGKEGLLDAEQMAAVAARMLGIKPADVLVASTGVIGKPLPMGKIINNVPQLVKRLSTKNNKDAAQAIMTTDTVKKEFAVRFKLDKNTITVGGMAKGSGMIHPNMATMLAFITTDAAISAAALKAALLESVEKSFNSISIDGDMSTNDMVLVLANAAAGNKPITPLTKTAFEKFSAALSKVTEALAKMIVKDGEGATKFIEVFVKGAKTQADAKLAARAVCNSPLVKTAIYGQDANWGRVAAAAGASKAEVCLEKISICFGRAKVLNSGKPVVFDENVLKKILSKKEIKITVDLGLGDASAKMWTCDFSEEYIRINARYRT